MKRMTIEPNWWNSLPYHNKMREQQKTEREYVDVSTSIHQWSSIIHRHQRTLFLGDVQRHIVRAFEQVQDERIREKLQKNIWDYRPGSSSILPGWVVPDLDCLPHGWAPSPILDSHRSLWNIPTEAVHCACAMEDVQWKSILVPLLQLISKIFPLISVEWNRREWVRIDHQYGSYCEIHLNYW